METTTPQTPPSPEQTRSCGPGHARRRGGIAVLLLIALMAGATGGYIGKSFAQAGPFGGQGAFASSDPAKIDAHVDRLVKHFAAGVDATPAQKDKLAAIAKGAARDLAPLHAKLQAAHKQAIALMGAPSVDRAAVETLRAERVALADTASKRVSQAFADAAEVLTPEQRQKIAARMQRRAERFERWSRG